MSIRRNIDHILPGKSVLACVSFFSTQRDVMLSKIVGECELRDLLTTYNLHEIKQIKQPLWRKLDDQWSLRTFRCLETDADALSLTLLFRHWCKRFRALSASAMQRSSILFQN